MDDEFLIKNDVVGYYRVKPTTIKYVDFYQEEKFEWKTFPANKTSALKFSLKMGLKRIGLWLRTIRAPFLTATFAPIFIGAAVAWNDLKENNLLTEWSWNMFWLVLFGASLEQIATNSSNDYFDHTSNADEINKVASPFNGGSRVIQVGLMTPGQVLLTALVSIVGTLNNSGVFTWGSLVNMQGENNIDSDDNQIKVVDVPGGNNVAMMWSEGSRYLYVNCGTVDSSNRSMTIGTQAEIVDDDGHVHYGADMAWDSTNSRGMVVVAHHTDSGSATRVHYRAFTVSSNEIALNTAEADVVNTFLYYPAIAFNEDAGHFIIAAQDADTHGLMYVATPNGSDETLSVGSAITYESDDIQGEIPSSGPAGLGTVGPRTIVAVYCSAGWGNIRGVLLHYTTDASDNVEGTFLQDVTNDFDGDGSYATSSASAQGTPIQCIGVASADYADNATNCSIITAGGKVTGLSGLRDIILSK